MRRKLNFLGATFFHPILTPCLHGFGNRGWFGGQEIGKLERPQWRKLVEQLNQGPVAASALAKPLGITLAAVVQHLQVLEESGLVRTKKMGRVRACHLDPAGFTVAAQWINERRALWERRLDRLGEILAAEENEVNSRNQP